MIMEINKAVEKYQRSIISPLNLKGKRMLDNNKGMNEINKVILDLYLTDTPTDIKYTSNANIRAKKIMPVISPTPKNTDTRTNNIIKTRPTK